MTVVYDDIKTDTSSLYRGVADMLDSLPVAEKQANRRCRKDCPACLAIAKAEDK